MFREAKLTTKIHSERNLHRLAFGLLSFMVILSWTPLYGISNDQEGADCPREWVYYISQIHEKYLSTMNLVVPVLLVDTDGRVRDCHDQGLSSDDLQELEEFETQFAQLVSLTAQVDSEGWPVNLCSFSETVMPAQRIRFVYLSYDREVLDSEVCKERVSRLWTQ